MRRSSLALIALVLLVIFGCRGKAPDAPAQGSGETWSVTSWGERYEVFAETEPLVAGRSATCNAHVTVLEGFAPLRSGSVTVVLRGSGPDLVFRQDGPKREGIFPVKLEPTSEGTFEMFFQVDGAAGVEELAGGRVRVGTPESPGGVAAGRVGREGAAGANAMSFLKEQQWRTTFATAPVTQGTLGESVAGPARIIPPAGGEVTLTATFDSTVAPSPWPYTGLVVAKGNTMLRLLPRIGGRSLPDLKADAASLEAEVEAARRRVERLTELLRVEATSVAELERARATLAGLEARLRSTREGVEVAGGRFDASAGISVAAPWTGRVAEVSVSPGQTVSAGAPLVRLVKARPVWMILALRPDDAARVKGRPSGLLIRRSGSPESIQFGPEDLRIVSQSPEVNVRTASIDLLVEIDRSVSNLPIGTGVEAELLLPGERRGIVVPASALVDDSGVVVAYVQIEGESFARKEVHVLARQGERVLIEGLAPGERLVTVGGGAVRRSVLLSTEAPEGHVH